MKNNKLFYIKFYLFIGIVIFIFIGFYLLMNRTIFINTENDKKIILNHNSFWVYNKKWSLENEINRFVGDYKLYIGDKYIGNSNMTKIGDTWKSNLTNIDENTKFLAHTSNMNVKVLPFKKIDITLDELANIVLRANIKDYNNIDMRSSKAYEINFNNNDIMDYLYIVTNLEFYSDTPNYYFILVVANIDGKDYTILNKKKISYTDSLMYPIYSLEYILNFDNSKNNSIIFKESYFSIDGSYINSLYQMKNGKIHLVFSGKDKGE